uniref:DDE Tnp4 domain-containing protein n=1 Tax=Phakopsora pachyrhizi TaxID=170000 RepID=A0A0S1MJC4_PHAPC
MDITINSKDYFGPGEYPLADSAYASTSTLVPAYRVSNCSIEAKKDFNTRLARSRVRNEHTIGILKGRWASLREMRNQIRSPQEMEYLTQWVSACIVLHNLLAKIGDKWEELFSEEDAPESAQELFPFDEENSSHHTSQTREKLLQLNLNHTQ